MYKDIEENLSQFADKRFGQNFLKDSTILDKIIEAMPKDGLPIVEIGPGLGDLTGQLLKVGQVRAYEVDKRLCEYLKSKFKESIDSGQLELKCIDILKEHGSLHKSSYSLIANLPYYIATKIVLNALHDSNCKRLIVMVQKEVADKFSAKVGDKEFGSLAILTQSIADVKTLFSVPPSAFVPPPKVTSAILYIEKSGSLDDLDFENFLKTATKQPRKTLFKNLSTIFDKNMLNKIFEKLNIKKSIRAHELDLSIYHHLYKELKKDIIDESRKRTTKQQRDKSR